MQGPTLRQIGLMLRDYHAQAAQSPGQTLSGLKIITACRVENIPDVVSLQRAKKNLEDSFADEYPRANPFVWSDTPSPRHEGLFDLNISFKRTVENTIVRSLIARELIHEINLCGFDLRKTDFAYHCVPAQHPATLRRPPQGDTPSAHL